MTPSQRSRIASLFCAVALAVSPFIAFAILTLYFPPDRYNFYPRCPILTYLHFECPGCGATRALAALLHGHAAEALGLNPLTTLLIPIGLLYLATHAWRQRHMPRIVIPHPPRLAVYALGAVATVFTLARNLHPGY